MTTGITLWQSLCNRAEAMRLEALQDVNTRAAWERIRPRRYREYMQSMGLDPLPARADLDCVDRGAFRGEGFTGRRVGFQLLPDCWSSACLFYPDPLPESPAPGVLYVCGHGPNGIYGYQHHPIFWARRGYVCLIVDTLEQGDNPGEHHALETARQEAWLSLGYTPAGGEVWNAMRALDILEADPRVDPARLAVTGLSGGGACSFHLAVADDRIKAVSTLCGVSTPYDAIVNRHLISHCNCIYPLNLHRHDTSVFAALIAPRAALFCFADDDNIFHPDVARDMVERTRRVYALYGDASRCEIVSCPGKHGDHPPFTEATSRWFDTHVAGSAHPLRTLGERELTEQTLSVFDGSPPTPNETDQLPHRLSPRGSVPLPACPEDWPAIREQALSPLRPVLASTGKAAFSVNGVWKKANGRLETCRGDIDGVDVWLTTLGDPSTCARLLLGVCGPGEGAMDLMGLAAGSVDDNGTTLAGGLEPRLAGVSHPLVTAGDCGNDLRKWSIRKLLPFALPLVGLTPVTVTVTDIGAALDFLTGRLDHPDCEVVLYGRGEAGVAALYLGLMDERVSGVILEDAPQSHLDGAPLPAVLRTLDLPQAVGLMAPRKMVLINPAHRNWNWAARAYGRLGVSGNLIEADSLRQAMAQLQAQRDPGD